ncbi:MAG: FAD-dependent oxidoreductase, partial [Victivallales bacterium]|nr:FAD-dependent oxidoreductase [Victivallales bacterium]
MKKYKYDAVVIGGGAAGMGAAREIRGNGYSVAIIEREEFLGGILMQCIHNGFGLRRFEKELTGPEYAETYRKLIDDSGIDVFLNATVVSVADSEGDHAKTLTALSADLGTLFFETKTIVLAMGCRERNRGNIGIPGTRPSGIFTAGLAQRLLNIDGYI